MAEGHHGDHPEFVAHHFDTADQQFDSGKFGMWLFLATEVLLFGGLFCAYSIYRALHPEIYGYAHHYLDVFWGATNTVVLITSSLTMAWGVRAAALGQRGLTTFMLLITPGCAAAFMIIKYVEYEHKFHSHLLPGLHFFPTEPPPVHHGAGEKHAGDAHGDDHGEHTNPEVDGWHDPDPEHRPKNVHIFFGIYFLMTGLHGLHVLAGMFAIGWILWRNLRRDFSPEYNQPVELVGLYWHLVDLIWIYLFPLLYLIS